MTSDEARDYMRANIDRLCAEQGISVEVTDPTMIAVAVQLLSIGRRKYEAEQAGHGDV